MLCFGENANKDFVSVFLLYLKVDSIFEKGFLIQGRKHGPMLKKLTTPLVNETLNFQTYYTKNRYLFGNKNERNFCITVLTKSVAAVYCCN